MDSHLECPEVRMLKDEDMCNPQHPDFARHKVRCKLLDDVCIEERTRGPNCPHLLWLNRIESQQPSKPHLGNLKICPKCGTWNLEFDPHQGAWMCLVKKCGAVYRNRVSEAETQQPDIGCSVDTLLPPEEINRLLALNLGNREQLALNIAANQNEHTRKIILTLLPSPVEGELAIMPSVVGNTPYEWDEVCQAQLAHTKAQGLVKLPSEDRAKEIVEQLGTMSVEEGITDLVLAHELLKLLGEVKK